MLVSKAEVHCQQVWDTNVIFIKYKKKKLRFCYFYFFNYEGVKNECSALADEKKKSMFYPN